MPGNTSYADLGCYDNGQLGIGRIVMDGKGKRNLAAGKMSGSCFCETGSVQVTQGVWRYLM